MRVEPHVVDHVGKGRTTPLHGLLLQHLKNTNQRLRPNHGTHWYSNLRDRCRRDKLYDKTQRCLGYTSELLLDPNVWTYEMIVSEAYDQEMMWANAQKERAHRRQLLLLSWDVGKRPGAD